MGIFSHRFIIGDDFKELVQRALNIEHLLLTHISINISAQEVVKITLEGSLTSEQLQKIKELLNEQA